MFMLLQRRDLESRLRQTDQVTRDSRLCFLEIVNSERQMKENMVTWSFLPGAALL